MEVAWYNYAMGIELPAPQGEAHVEQQPGTERPVGPFSSEQAPALHSAEIMTTERPSSQELRTGQGAGDGYTTPISNDVTSTSPPVAQPTSSASMTSLDDVPVIAADEDLIEKQWIDSAKRIIKETSDDPYKQGEAISRLQADYLQKRYGKSISGNEA